MARELDGPLGFMVAVANAHLGKAAKAILLGGLGPHINWKTLECYPKVETISKNCGYGVRHVQGVLRNLTEIGVLTRVHGAPGLETNTYRLCFEQLKSRATPAMAAGVSPAVQDEHPRNPRPSPPQSTTFTPAMVAGEHTHEHTKEHTTTTTPERPNGGGGGGVGVEERRKAWADQLVSAGVGRSLAGALAVLPHMSDDLLAFVIEQAGKPGVHHRGKFIAKLLSVSIDDLDGWEAFRARRLNARREGYRRVLERGRKVPSEHATARQESMNMIQRSWSTLDQLAEFGPLSHEEVWSTRGEDAVLFQRIVDAAAARQHANVSASGLESCAMQALQCHGDHRQPDAEEVRAWHQ